MQSFLYKLQDRYFILICFFVTLTVYVFIRLDAILQLAINFGVAIIALSQKKQEPQTAISTDTVQTDSVTTDSIDNSTVNAKNLNVKDPKE
jgi:hypothetical protein